MQAKIPPLTVPAAKWWQAIGFCLLMSLLGLRLYPLILVMLMFFVWIVRKDRYFFTVELMILIGGFGFMNADALPIKIIDPAMFLCLFMLFAYRKPRPLKWITWSMLAYFAVLILLASTSLESMSVQFYRMRYYFVIIVFFIPLLCFANNRCEWPKFIEALAVHALVICGFYVVDTFIIGGFMLLPGTTRGSHVVSLINYYYGDFGCRHYPPGLYLLLPLIPALNFGKLRFSWFHWLLIVGALYSSKTNSMLFALIACWVFFRPKIKQVLAYSVAAVVMGIGLYTVDNALGSPLRFSYNIDQFSALDMAQDDEDLAEFGTGRMAQILPKWELLSDMNRLHLGFGFLHPTKTTNPKFQIRNEFYTDVSNADEIATEVEVTEVQTILDVGFIGFLAQLAFFVGIYFIIRKFEHSRVYLCTLVGIEVLGLGGFAGLNGPHGLTLLGFVLGTVLAANKSQTIADQSQLTA